MQALRWVVGRDLAAFKSIIVKGAKRAAETNNMARFPGIGVSRGRSRHARGTRTTRQLLVERLEGRVVLDTGLTPGTSTAVAATAGTLVTDVPLVTFTDGASPLPANDYAATID